MPLAALAAPTVVFHAQLTLKLQAPHPGAHTDSRGRLSAAWMPPPAHSTHAIASALAPTTAPMAKRMHAAWPCRLSAAAAAALPAAAAASETMPSHATCSARSAPASRNCSVVDDAVKSTMKPEVAAAACGRIPSSSSSGPFTNPPPMPRRPASTPAHALTIGASTRFRVVHRGPPLSATGAAAATAASWRAAARVSSSGKKAESASSSHQPREHGRTLGAPSVRPCSRGWWLLLALSAFFPLLLTRAAARQLAAVAAAAPVADSGGPRWTTRNLVLAPMVSACAGVLAGLLGIGGGLVKGPLLLELGMRPQAAAATSGFMVLFTASSTTLQFLLAGALRAEHVAWLGMVSLAAAAAGSAAAAAALRRQGHAACILFAIGAVVGASALAIAWVEWAGGGIHAADSRPRESVCAPG